MSRTALVIGALGATLIGCSDQSLHAIDDANGAGGPEIAVDPEVIDFGTASRGEYRNDVFTVTNVGEGDLHVSEIVLADDDAGFSILSETLDFYLPAGASQEIEVDWTPFGVSQKNNVFVTSDDEDVEKATVELRGEGLVPELKIDPDPYDLGNTYVGCPRTGQIDLVNVGTDVLDVEYVDVFNDGYFEIENPNTLPATLQSGESIPLYVTFDPDEDISYDGEIVVTSTEPKGTRTGTQTGLGLYTAEYKEKWEVPYDPPSDIMFLVDQSCSMDDDQTRLANNFELFADTLNDYTSDWQIIVVNDDDGCTNSGILVPGGSSWRDRFKSAVKKGGGSFTESLLTPAAYATGKSGSGQCNAGFMRDGALLHIIAVSDEPEQSPYTSGYSWSQLVDMMVANKGSASLVKVSAIVGDYPSGCSTADPGTGYYEAANYTGGEFLSICASSWSGYMSALAEASISMDTYELNATPVEHTLWVAVNDVERTSGWYYDSGGNSVIITENIPEGGDVVKVTYAGLANCD